ncbi:ATP-binding protein [Streptomyces sp. NPDC059352]|uniref:ATP-binding protein n=1 Tax=Streptomyces sp. NPDC059352 TaxID=3346810 RepID=UPI0036B8EB50
MISEPSRYYAVELQALPSRIGQVRRIVSAHLRHWHLDALIDQAALGVTELLTNVHRHAQPDKRCTVEIELLLDRLTVSVRDHDPRIPAAGSLGGLGGPDECEGLAAFEAGDGLATSGRGLAIVRAVSESWGIRPCGEDGKVVWFTLSAPPPVVPFEEHAHALQGSTTESPYGGYAPFPGVPFGTPAEPALAPISARTVRTVLAGGAARSAGTVPAGRVG